MVSFEGGEESCHHIVILKNAVPKNNSKLGSSLKVFKFKLKQREDIKKLRKILVYFHYIILNAYMICLYLFKKL